jgi:predicted nucleic acid-binding protein
VARLLGPFRELAVTATWPSGRVRIRGESGIRLPDALIAATALQYRLGLATRNRADFSRVRGLRLRSLR